MKALTGTFTLALVWAFAGCAASAPPSQPVSPTPAAAPVAPSPAPVVPVPASTTPVASESPSATAAPAPAAPPRPAPATGAAASEPADSADGLARGTGEPADKELGLGDNAYDAEKYKEARQHYRKAEQLAPKDPAPKVGLVRVSVAESNLPLDYAAAPRDPRIAPLIKQLDAALKLDADYAPALLERGHLLLIQGKADLASSNLQRAAELLPRHAETQLE